MFLEMKANSECISVAGGGWGGRAFSRNVGRPRGVRFSAQLEDRVAPSPPRGGGAGVGTAQPCCPRATPSTHRPGARRATSVCALGGTRQSTGTDWAQTGANGAHPTTVGSAPGAHCRVLDGGHRAPQTEREPGPPGPSLQSRGNRQKTRKISKFSPMSSGDHRQGDKDSRGWGGELWLLTERAGRL